MPLKKKQKPHKYVNIALTENNHDKLMRLKKFYGLSQQDIINELIRDYKDPEKERQNLS